MANLPPSPTGIRREFYIFFALACLGFFAQWIIMVINGSFFAMLLTTYQNVFQKHASKWTGVLPIDFLLDLLFVFFGAVLNEPQKDNFSAYLILVDLIFTLGVCNTMTLIESRRGSYKGLLRYPGLWQILWNYCGAASILPLYLRLYFKRQASRPPAITHDQALGLPLTALWLLALTMPLLAPSILEAGSSRVQQGVLIWFLSPLTVGPFQDLVAARISRCLGSAYTHIASPVTIAYLIVGTISAVVHLGTITWAVINPRLSYSEIYWPVYQPTKDQSSLIVEGATGFLKWGHLSIAISVLVVGVILISSKGVDFGESLVRKWQMGRSIMMFGALTMIVGPGAGLALLLCMRERGIAAANAFDKES